MVTNNPNAEIDWTVTTWEGSRRAQLRNWCELTLRERLQALEEMTDISRHFAEMRAKGRFKDVRKHSEAGAAEIGAVHERAAPGASVHEIFLHGCTPEPLMNYLKALGVLRLVSEQADKRARGFWRNGVFVIHGTLKKQALLEFFLQHYQPTPILSPWNGDAGFLSDSGTAYSTVQKLKADTAPRLERIRAGISTIESMPIVQDFGLARQRRKEMENNLNVKYGTKADKWKKRATNQEKERHAELAKHEKKLKESVVSQLRGDFPDISLPWLDACLVLQNEGFSTSPLMGSGGVDGRMEFSANFLANVLAILENATSTLWLKTSLFQSPSQIMETSIGQFAPGRIGGPNATQGMEGTSLLNPWDYVLMLEGSVLFAGAISRKWGVTRQAKAGFPFTVMSVATGDPSLARKESKESRGELWLPLWYRPACISEIKHFLAEGRAEWGGRQSDTAVDFARAATSLGVERGISSFCRQGFLKRNGLAFIAAPLGRVDVKVRAQVDLLKEIDPWLNRFRGACKIGQKGEAPARLTGALRHIESTIFNYCRYGGNRHFHALLTALGGAERELMRGNTWADKNRVPPLVGLSGEWITAADDGSPEFELALALAGIYDAHFKLGSIRTNLEPVNVARRKWAEKDRAAVWNAADLSTNLANVLARRIMDGNREGCDRLPLASRQTATLDTMSAFLAKGTDDRLVEELLWGLMLIDAQGQRQPPRSRRRVDSPPLPRAYALLKLLFLPRSLIQCRDRNGRPRWRYARSREQGVEVRAEPRILPLLRAGRIEQTCEIAMHRLRASGLVPMPNRSHWVRSCGRTWEGLDRTLDGQRVAAALLIPLGSRSVERLIRLVTRQHEESEAKFVIA